MVAPDHTMVEIHSNFTIDGTKKVIDGVYPTNHAEHETLEITQGFTDWFETGFYVFTSIQPDSGWQWVGDHIRPRFRIPEKWHWPVGVSLSNEIGYQRAAFSADTWTWEIRPIVDKKLGPWYLAFNPAGRSLVARPRSIKGRRVLAECEIQLRRYQEDRGRTGILRGLGAADWLCRIPPTTATICSGDRHRPWTRLGVQCGLGGWGHIRNGPLNCEVHPWAAIFVDAKKIETCRGAVTRSSYQRSRRIGQGCPWGWQSADR